MKNTIIGILILLTIALVFGYFSRDGKTNESSGAENIGTVVKIANIDIYKTPTCGCCGVYSKYLSGKGISVNEIDLPDLTATKDEYGIPHELMSCHTSIVGGYFVEGHIPLEAIEKLLSLKPDIAGIALPGMPSGTPGMAGAKSEEWIIYSIGNDGEVSEFLKI